MINGNKWISSIQNRKTDENISNQANHEKWENSIPSKKNYNSVKKYSLISILFIFGLLLVSTVKNESRGLQKEINSLEASNKIIKFNLDQAILDNEVIHSPDNISILAKRYLNEDLASYKRSQIKKLNDKNNILDNEIILKKETSHKKKEFVNNIKTDVKKIIEQKKTKIQSLQNIYSNPKEIPSAIKIKVVAKIQKKKNELKNMYDSPREIFKPSKFSKWGIVQVVKLFLGIPVFPGR